MNSFNAVETLDYELDLIEYGNATVETKQVAPSGRVPDCYYGIGYVYGC